MNFLTVPDEKLSEHFRLHELLRSDTAEKLGLDNSPTGTVIEALRFLAARLEIVRAALGGKPMRINSGFRCLQLNRAIGSKDTSDHIKGMAADFVCPSFGPPDEVCDRLVSTDIPFKQLIYEGTWVHISFDYQAELAGMRPRRQVLTLVAGGGYVTGIKTTGRVA